MSRCTFVCDNIRRNKFNKVSQYHHAADSDDLSKEIVIGRVFEYLEPKQNFKGNCIWDREFDVDVCMVDFGRYGIFLTQSNTTKPTRFGYKLWYTNLPLGYLINFPVYKGSTFHKSDSVTKYVLDHGHIIGRLPIIITLFLYLLLLITFSTHLTWLIIALS